MLINFSAEFNKAMDGLYALAGGSSNVLEVEREPLVFTRDAMTFTQNYVIWVVTAKGPCYFSAWSRGDELAARKSYSEYYSKDEILWMMLAGQWRRCRNGSHTWVEVEITKDASIVIAPRGLVPGPQPPWLEGWPE